MGVYTKVNDRSQNEQTQSRCAVLIIFNWSGRTDLNRGPLAPHLYPRDKPRLSTTLYRRESLESSVMPFCGLLPIFNLTVPHLPHEKVFLIPAQWHNQKYPYTSVGKSPPKAKPHKAKRRWRVVKHRYYKKAFFYLWVCD